MAEKPLNADEGISARAARMRGGGMAKRMRNNKSSIVLHDSAANILTRNDHTDVIIENMTARMTGNFSYRLVVVNDRALFTQD